MAYPILAAQNTWFAGKCSQSPTYFTEITIMDSYTPEGTVESWDASAAGDGSVMCYVVGTKLIIAGNGSGKIEMNEDSSTFFLMDVSNAGILPSSEKGFKNITKLSGLEYFYTENVKKLSHAFSGMYKLEFLDLSSWKLPNLEDLSNLISCTSVKEINITGWYTPKVKNIQTIFGNTGGIMDKNLKGVEKIIGFENWELPNLTSASGCFVKNKNITTLNLTKWNVSNVTNFMDFFRDSNIEKLDISNWDTTKSTNYLRFFDNCTTLKEIKLGPNFSIYGDGTITEENKFVLPTPSYEGADGNWYTFNGDSYAPNAVKDKTAETYYGSYDMVANLDVICKNGSLIEIAKAIREKNGATDKYTLSQMADAIRNFI